MAPEVSLAVLVRMAGPALFVLLGTAVVILARRRRERAALGAFLAAFGGWLVASNLGLVGGGALFFVVSLLFSYPRP